MISWNTDGIDKQKINKEVIMHKKIAIFLILFSIVASMSVAAHLKVTDIVGIIKPAVVTIITFNENGEMTGQGTGFFVGENQIISSRHVFEGVSNAKIKTSRGEIYSILGVIAEDPKWDLILLKTETIDNKATPLVITDKYPKEGQKIVVIGSPKGFEQTISDGIVSSIRDIPNSGKIIQITAPISPGSSGSPVVNLLGEVIGVATLQMHHAQQLNFAVPAEHILALSGTYVKSLAQWTAENKKQNAETNVFEDDKLGYKIEYPYNWICEKSGQYKILFSGKEGTDAYYSTINIQNLASKKTGGGYDDVSSIVKDFKKQIMTHNEDTKFYNERQFVYKTTNGAILTGEEFIVEYTKSGEKFKQWQIIIPKYNGETFYAWIYNSPADMYDTYLEVAKKMLDSWKIN